jgi:hypothetical protein
MGTWWERRCADVKRMKVLRLPRGSHNVLRLTISRLMRTRTVIARLNVKEILQKIPCAEDLAF